MKIINFQSWLNLRENKELQANYSPKWKKPDLYEEKDEITRQAKESNINQHKLLQNIKDGKLVNLTNNMWEKMENTASNDPHINIKKVMQWKKHKDVDGILHGFENGDTLPAPIVLIHKNKPILVAGNTRLTIAKLLNVKPKIWLAKY
jgi:hypothetical protein